MITRSCLAALAILFVSQSGPAIASSPLRTVSAMNRAASQIPDGRTPGSAIQVYPWSEGALFHLFTTPGAVSDIALEPGEALISVAAGDTARWIVGDTSSGSGATKQVHILVKPVAVGLATNMVISTGRRTYHLALSSTSHVAMAEVRWIYPATALLSLTGTGASDDAATTTSVAPAAGTLNFDYLISGEHVSWRPVIAFDDGRKTYLKFPPSLGEHEAPPLFVIGKRGEPQLVNYRVQKDLYIVDQLFDVAELRLGTRSQQIVRITRGASGTEHQP